MENGKASATYIIGRYIEKERVMEVRWGRERERDGGEVGERGNAEEQ